MCEKTVEDIESLIGNYCGHRSVELTDNEFELFTKALDLKVSLVQSLLENMRELTESLLAANPVVNEEGHFSFVKTTYGDLHNMYIALQVDDLLDASSWVWVANELFASDGHLQAELDMKVFSRLGESGISINEDFEYEINFKEFFDSLDVSIVKG